MQFMHQNNGLCTKSRAVPSTTSNWMEMIENTNSMHKNKDVLLSLWQAHLHLKWILHLIFNCILLSHSGLYTAYLCCGYHVHRPQFNSTYWFFQIACTYMSAHVHVFHSFIWREHKGKYHANTGEICLHYQLKYENNAIVQCFKEIVVNLLVVVVAYSWNGITMQKGFKFFIGTYWWF